MELLNKKLHRAVGFLQKYAYPALTLFNIPDVDKKIKRVDSARSEELQSALGVFVSKRDELPDVQKRLIDNI